MTLSASDAAHLLRRTGFGVTPAMLAEVTALPSRAEAIARVTDVSLDPSTADCPVGDGKPTNDYAAWGSLTLWWTERMRTSPVPLVEKLALFWHDHFVSSFVKIRDMGLMAQQHRLFRAHGLGDFHELAQKVAVNPAMLVYLDNFVNVVRRPQENFGREVMELFTLGVDEYTQDDVVAMTRAWTGHSLDPAVGYRTYKYVPTWHDTATSTLFGTTRSWQGPDALTEVIKGSKAEVSARFITAKLFSYFAYPVSPGDAVVGPLAESYLANDRNVLALVREILGSDAFWSAEARSALVRSPLEWLVATMQATGLDSKTCVSAPWLERVGQVPFMHADVNGWPTGTDWVSTASAWAKENLADNVRYTLFNKGFLSNLSSLSASAAVDAACEKLGIVDLTPTTRAALEGLHARSKAGGYAYTIGINMTMVLLLSPEFQTS